MRPVAWRTQREQVVGTLGERTTTIRCGAREVDAVAAGARGQRRASGPSASSSSLSRSPWSCHSTCCCARSLTSSSASTVAAVLERLLLQRRQRLERDVQAAEVLDAARRCRLALAAAVRERRRDVLLEHDLGAEQPRQLAADVRRGPRRSAPRRSACGGRRRSPRARGSARPAPRRAGRSRSPPRPGRRARSSARSRSAGTRAGAASRRRARRRPSRPRASGSTASSRSPRRGSRR